jgi:hypothetical protein
VFLAAVMTILLTISQPYLHKLIHNQSQEDDDS